MKVLYISNLFPDETEFSRGLFNARFVRHFSELCEIKVISPRPSFLFWKKYYPCPQDVSVSPEYQAVPYVPLWGTLFNHRLMYLFLIKKILKIKDKFKFDIILASWIFPDGCAACRIGRKLNVPVVVTALGTDIHQYAYFPLRKKIIFKELESAKAVVTVSRSLAKILEGRGFPVDKLCVIYYGVEQNIFHPADKSETRKMLGLSQDEKIILFVGNLLPVKDPLLTLDSFFVLEHKLGVQNSRLIFIGSGPLEKKLRNRAKLYNITDKIVFAGKKRVEETAKFMQAADVLCLTSHNEGVPNVVLEALSCGTPVVTTKVGGIPEVLSDDITSVMVDSRSPEIIARAILDILNTKYDRNVLSKYAGKYKWEQTALEYHELLKQVLNNIKHN